jgi:YVTN family beta-propeller protein
MMNSKLFCIATLMLGVILVSCEKQSEDLPVGQYSKGVVIINEGSAESTVSFLSTDSSKIYNNIYYSANAGSLGQYAQSATYYDGKYYLMVSGSDKVVIVNQLDFTKKDTISGLIKPRYMQVINSQKAYITQWGKGGLDGSVAVLDLNTKTVSKIIKTGLGSEKMVMVNNMVYVANEGGYGNDSTVSVINTSTDAVVATIKAGYNPRYIVADKNNKVWAMGIGTFSGEPSSLVCIDPSTNTVEKKFDFAYSEYSPGLSVNTSKDMLIFHFSGNVYEMSITATTLPTVAKIHRSFYNLAVDPKNGYIYGTDVKDYKVNGYVIRYKPTYEKIDSFQVGIVPGDILFNN